MIAQGQLSWASSSTQLIRSTICVRALSVMSIPVSRVKRSQMRFVPSPWVVRCRSCSSRFWQVHELLCVIHILHKRAAAFHIKHLHDVSEVGILHHCFGCSIEFHHPRRAM